MTVENIQGTLAGRAQEEAPQEPELFSAEWWQVLSAEELRDIIKRGYGVGPAYDGAVAETERRAREALKRVRESESASRHRIAIIRLSLLGAVLAIVIAIGIIEWAMS
jgi:hypothetical protein